MMSTSLDRDLEFLAISHCDQPTEESLEALRRWLESYQVAPRHRPMSPLPRPIGDPDTWYAVNLINTPNCTLTVFALPAGAQIPLHDHPDMTVLMRVLSGRAHIEAWDRCGADFASLSMDREIGPDSPILVTAPIERNLHRIQAITEFAFIDLLTPPYDPNQGRVCHYYRTEKTDESSLYRLYIAD